MMNLVSEPVTHRVVGLSVDFELCEAFRAPIEHDEPICASCGHLADDHEQMASDAA